MSGVPASFAEWLRSQELIEQLDDGAVLAAWGDLAIDSSTSSVLADSVDAADEVARQMQFFGFPLAVETVVVPGRQSGLVGLSRRIAADADGYSAAPAVFVIGADEQEGGVTALTVLRRVEQA